MIKEKNSLHEENIHFTYNVEFSKFLCETNKEKIEKKFPISLNKETFDYYLYVHRVFFFFKILDLFTIQFLFPRYLDIFKG